MLTGETTRMDQRMDTDLAPHREPDACAYCGARLNPLFYFCTTCATPYKDHKVVVSRARPEPISARQLVHRRAPVVWPLFWTYFCVLLGGSVIAWLAFGDQPALGMFFMDGALGVTTIFFAVWHWKSLAPQLAAIGFDHWEAWAGLGLLVPALALNFAYHGLISEFADAEGPSWIDGLRDAGLSQGALIFFICVFPAVTEEIAFRGLVQQWLRVAIGPMKAILLASALFAAMHLTVISAPYLFLVGLLLGWVKWKTGSLYPPMVIHLIHNWAVLQYA